VRPPAAAFRGSDSDRLSGFQQCAKGRLANLVVRVGWRIWTVQKNLRIRGRSKGRALAALRATAGAVADMNHGRPYTSELLAGTKGRTPDLLSHYEGGSFVAGSSR
jgi:hypothetical protein